MTLALAVPTAARAAGAETPTAPAAYVSPAETRLKADVSYLASDLREGRGAGTKGLDEAADHIADVFREAGLKPPPGAGEGYFQPFDIPGEARATAIGPLTLQGPESRTFKLESGSDYTPLQRGGGAALKDVPVVFAGYGITAQDRDLKLDYDDYKDLDAKGKAVLILRQEPQMDREDSPFAGKEITSFATLRHKARNAAEHGAAAVLMVNNAPSLKGGKDALLNFSDTDGDGTGIPFLMLTRASADRLLQAAGQPPIADLERDIDRDLRPAGRALDGWTLSAEIKVEKAPFAIKNVVGVLDGAGPLADETIIVGAHYDHVGYGGQGSLAPGTRAIHNGADDNASGTAVVMELARRMARRHDPLPRRVVFMTFAGEERGLLGSKHYVDHPLFPLDKTIAMFNFDMVGRLNGKHELIVFGAPSVEGLDALVTDLAKSEGLTPKIVPDTSMEFNSSDHASFYRKEIPVFFAFTGTHPDYHRPSDDIEKINFEGMSQIADLGELLLLDVARRPERPKFKKLPAPAPGTGRRALAGRGAYLGTRPSYGETDIKGVKLDGVSEGSPAEKAGLKGGDVVVKFDGKPIANIEDYMEGLNKHRPGDTVEITVERDGKEESVKVTLGSRPAPN
jgi:hypothetical protein